MDYIGKRVLLELYHTFKKPLLIVLLGFIGLLLFIPVFTYLYFAKDLTSKEYIMNRNNTGVTLLDRGGIPFFTFGQVTERTFVPLDVIPVNLQNAVIASEDREFYTHPGFSIRAIFRSLFTNIAQDKLAYGGSTLTQQLVKNALLTPQRSLLRKYQELALAFEIERRYSKKEILEMYLNSIYLGDGAIGVEDASESYFGKHAKNLTLGESAFLVGILPAPSYFSPRTGNGQKAIEQQHLVLDQMQQQGYIASWRKDLAEKQPLIFVPQKPSALNRNAPHFALMVKDELEKKYGEEQVARSGFKVKTTIDLNFQKYAELIVAEQAQNLTYNKASNAAAVAIDPKSGEILTLVGSKDWYNTDFGKVNIVTSKRQPGSSFKPIIYAKALEERVITASTILKDEPTTFPGNYKPKDFDGKYRGNVTVRRALTNSLNIPSVSVMEKVGVENGIEMAQRLGITNLKDPSNYGLSLVLGAAEVKLLDLTSAYGVFANGGIKVTPTTILEIKDKRDNVIFTKNPTLQQVLDPQIAYIISSILSDNAARAEEFGSALTISRPAAVKTGTTEDFRDALTIGYTPSLVIGVWVGNNDNSSMDNVAGSLGAAPIWRRLMEKFLLKTKIENFPRPSGLVLLTICRENGLRARVSTSSAMTEYFLPGTEPSSYCAASDEASLTPSQTPSPSISPTQTPTDTPTETPTPTQAPTATPTQSISLTPTQTPTPTPQIPITILPGQ